MSDSSTVRRTFKYRLKPTRAQRTQLEQTLEACRSAYNATLAVRKNTYERTSKGLSRYDTHKLLPGKPTSRR